MINKVLYSMTKKLKDEYDYKIYIDQVEQDFKTPSFYLKCVDFGNQKLLTNERTPYHNKSTVSFSLTYFPDEELKEVTEELSTKITEIVYILELLETDNFKTRLQSFNTQIIDKTLIIVLDYKINAFRVNNATDGNLMDNLIETNNIKGGI